MIHWLLVFSILFASTVRAATPPEKCDPREAQAVAPSKPSAYDMSQVICEAANNGRLKPDAETIAGSCGVGGKEAVEILGQTLSRAGDGIASTASAAYTKSADFIAGLWRSSPDPAKAAEDSAKANAENAKTWLQTARDYAEASKLLMEAFYKELYFSVQLVGYSMGCLPWKFVTKYLCQAVSMLFLDWATMKTVVTAVDKGVAATTAVRKFMKQTNMIDEMKNLTLAERLAAGSAALQFQAEAKTLEKLGTAGTLKSRTDPITRTETLYFEERALIDGKVVTSMREIPKDAKTLAIDANFETGAKVARLTSEAAKGEHLVFFDVNNLGKVNYFKAGTAAGDDYLRLVGENIRKNLRPEDRFFKNGGDELVVVLRSKDPKVVKNMIARIHQSIDKDKELQAIFHAQRTALASEIKAANKASGSLKNPTKEQLAPLLDAAKVRPSVSVGSTKIKGNWKQDLAAAEKQAGDVKSAYKIEMGADASKYGRGGGASGRPNLKAKPKVLDPVQ